MEDQIMMDCTLLSEAEEAFSLVSGGNEGMLDSSTFGKFIRILLDRTGIDLYRKHALRRVFRDIQKARATISDIPIIFNSAKDGSITLDEMRSYTRLRGYDVDLLSAWKVSDTDEDGVISWREFGKLAECLKEGGPLGMCELPRVFRGMDKDHDGRIDKAELDSLLQRDGHLPRRPSRP